MVSESVNCLQPIKSARYPAPTPRVPRVTGSSTNDDGQTLATKPSGLQQNNVIGNRLTNNPRRRINADLYKLFEQFSPPNALSSSKAKTTTTDGGKDKNERTNLWCPPSPHPCLCEGCPSISCCITLILLYICLFVLCICNRFMNALIYSDLAFSRGGLVGQRLLPLIWSRMVAHALLWLPAA